MHQFVDQFEQLYQCAISENDNVLHQMLHAFLYNPETWDSWEEFLVDVVLALSAVNKASQEHLIEVLKKQAPMVIYTDC